VKSLADTEVVFGLVPGTEDQIALRAGDGLDDRTGIGLQGAFVRPVVEILAQTGHSAEFVQPLDPVFEIEAGARFDHMVVAR